MDFLSQMDVVILSLSTLILGMAILVKGGDYTIDGAVAIARYYGMPPLLVGFTIVAFGTSLPELIASINANMNDMPSIAVGGMIGSNISNILLVGGVCAMIAPLMAHPNRLRNDLIMLMIVTCVWGYLLATMVITPLIGAISVAALIAYIIIQYHLASKDKNQEMAPSNIENDQEDDAPKNPKAAFVAILIGLVGLALGAELLIRGAVTTARIIGIQESVIGLTIVALGTSLPELTTCAIAAVKRQGDMIIGNIIGSNIFNLMMVLGGIAMIKPYGIIDSEPTLIGQDTPIMVGVTVVFITSSIVFKKLPRIVGGIFTLAYIGYIGLLAVQSL